MLRAAMLVVALVWTAISVSQSGAGAQSMTFRTALEANDRQALRAEIDKLLAAQDPSETTQSRMEALRRWIADRDGVASAKLNPDLLDTEPPIQQIWVTLEESPEDTHTIGILLDPRGFRFNMP